MILVIDNRDSFTFNLVQLFATLGADVEVLRADALVAETGIDVNAVETREPRGLILGPGPGPPERASASLALVETFGPRIPILGVCLGHQCLAVALGARCVRSRKLTHGSTSVVEHDGHGLFEGLAPRFAATRYNSLAVDAASVPDELVISARAPDGEVLGLRHVRWPAEAVQFHPEAILSEHGPALARNFLARLEPA